MSPGSPKGFRPSERLLDSAGCVNGKCHLHTRNRLGQVAGKARCLPTLIKTSNPHAIPKTPLLLKRSCHCDDRCAGDDGGSKASARNNMPSVLSEPPA